MKRFLINTLKVIMLPVIVYLIFLVICFERFSNWNCIYTIFIQTIIPTITAYAIAYGNICGVFDFTIGSRLVISGVIGGLLAAQYGFAGMILGAVIGLLVAHPKMNLPAFTGFHNDTLGDLFPILFVTVACGAVSGFHSLVSSGTSSKTISNEKDMLKVGYGAMILESLLAILALCVAGAAAAADGTAASGTPFQIFSSGVAGFFEMFGIPVYAAQCFMTMCVSALALTSLDSVARIGRMSFQELFSVDDMEHAEGWRKVFCNKYFATVLTLACGFILTKIGYANIWPLFGSANQLLSALVLITLCVFLKVTGRKNRTLFPPLIIMLCVTFTALVERTIGLVKAYSAGSAVFLVEGLQLIIAILLMILGVTIVVHSGKELVKKKAEN